MALTRKGMYGFNPGSEVFAHLDAGDFIFTRYLLVHSLWNDPNRIKGPAVVVCSGEAHHESSGEYGSGILLDGTPVQFCPHFVMSKVL